MLNISYCLVLVDSAVLLTRAGDLRFGARFLCDNAVVMHSGAAYRLVLPTCFSSQSPHPAATTGVIFICDNAASRRAECCGAVYHPVLAAFAVLQSPPSDGTKSAGAIFLYAVGPRRGTRGWWGGGGVRPPLGRRKTIQNTPFNSIQAPVHHWAPSPGRNPVSAPKIPTRRVRQRILALTDSFPCCGAAFSSITLRFVASSCP